ncbi:hypothetical protein PVAND_016062 [Polypedilum vanderplanki]|uniref:Uncharacterized protein n=1 Tax=Polypedilum vanderplanki TaxID=319348 RepID=A0A9J6BEC8_POLVA|nr:hypothetical protein PVAND_016062 [Polypedilum vanderplanki]
MRKKILLIFTIFTIVTVTSATFNLEFFGFINPFVRSSSYNSRSNRSNFYSRLYNRLFNNNNYYRRYYPYYYYSRRQQSSIFNNGLSFFNFLNGYRTGYSVGSSRRNYYPDSWDDYYDYNGYNNNYYDSNSRPYYFNYNFYG